MASKSLVDNLKDKDKIIKQINKNGFNILKKYNLVDIDYDKNNKFINYMKFEIKENPLLPIYCDEYYDEDDEDNDGYEDNGIIYLTFNSLEEGFIYFHISLVAQCKCSNNYGQNTIYDRYFDSYSYETNRIFKQLTKELLICDKNIKKCIEVQKEIDEKDYQENLIRREEKANELFNKKIDELTKEETEELEYEIEFENEGIATYNQLVMDGYISDID